jgi:hypothetical protein
MEICYQPNLVNPEVPMLRSLTRVTFLLFLLSACDEAPTGTGSTDESILLTPGAGARTEGIQALVDAQVAAWSAKDATAFASTYAVDAKLFNPIGGVLDGREGIHSQHAFLFSGPFAGSTEALVLTGTRFLTGTIAIAGRG